MSITPIALACLSAALVSAWTAGVFQSFSDFIMRGLVAAGTTAGMPAMQGLNRTVLRSFFLTGFFALVPATLGLAIHAWSALDGIAQGLIVLAAVTYLSSVFLLTVFGNVPMNNRLDRLDPLTEEGARYWDLYARRWTRLNHVRTAGSMFTSVLLIAAAWSLG